MPQISIIVPVFNGSSFIPSLLETVSAQTLTDWELIIVDDGSTDDLAIQLAQAPPDDRRRVLRHSNTGRSSARNRGLASAQAGLVAFLDVDDAWQPIYLASMIAALEQAPEAVAAYCGWQYMDAAGQPLPQTVIPSAQDAARLAADLPWRNSLLPSGLVARRQPTLQAGGFDEALHGTEDWDLWLRLIGHGPFVAVPRALTWYRTHAQSTTENVINMERERLKVHIKHLGPLDGPASGWPLALRRAVGYTYFNTALGLLWQHDLDGGRERLSRAVQVWPGLLDLDEFYYELGCANQPRGRRGTADGLDLTAGEALIRGALFEGAPPLPRSAARAHWYHASLILARLARNARRWSDCRHYAWRAMASTSNQDRREALRLLARSRVPEALWPPRRAQQPPAQP